MNVYVIKHELPLNTCEEITEPDTPEEESDDDLMDKDKYYR